MSQGRPSIVSTRLPLAAAIFVGLTCVAILALNALQEWNGRTAHLQNAEMDMANLSRSLTQHAEDSFALLDANILGAVARLEKDGTGPGVISKLQDILKIRKAETSRIQGLFIFDEKGNWLATSENLETSTFNNGDRDYFRHHMQSNDPGMFLGKPVKSRSSDEWVITVSRRFEHPDGRFAGVVSATISTEYFAEFYRQFETGEHGSISLLSTDGIILARSPDNAASVGRDMSKLPLFRNLIAGKRIGSYHFKSPLDGRQRVSFFKIGDRLPIAVLSTMSEDEVLAPWRKDAFARMMSVIALVLMIAGIGFFLVRHMFMRHNLGLALAAKEADFRLLAEESSDMVTRIGLDERLLYVSPSSSRLVGWTPEQLTGTPALAGVNAEDKPEVDEAVAALKRGDMQDTRLIYRTRHREHGEIWLESTMRVTRTLETGVIDGVVAISRDVTQQKSTQDQLAALAITDGLTGLANRRHFDNRLQEEWARAHREGSLLSLLLIDVDHFKMFNDRYGHPTGDTCLRSLAIVLAGEARRPGDLAARYGGEEFVLLLPNTDEAGCRLLAENIRRELRKLHITHAQNPPSKCVTVSLGGATIRPNADGIDSTLFVNAADQALYTAKERGRDQLVMWEPATQPDSKTA